MPRIAAKQAPSQVRYGTQLDQGVEALPEFALQTQHFVLAV